MRSELQKKMDQFQEIAKKINVEVVITFHTEVEEADTEPMPLRDFVIELTEWMEDNQATEQSEVPPLTVREKEILHYYQLEDRPFGSDAFAHRMMGRLRMRQYFDVKYQEKEAFDGHFTQEEEMLAQKYEECEECEEKSSLTKRNQLLSELGKLRIRHLLKR